MPSPVRAVHLGVLLIGFAIVVIVSSLADAQQRTSPSATTETVRDPDPPPAECDADEFSEPIGVKKIPIMDYASNVHPPLSNLSIAYTSAYKQFTIPFDDFWKLTGLQWVFPDAVGECCKSCPDQACGTITFEKIAGKQGLARFIVVIRRNNNLHDLDLQSTVGNLTTTYQQSSVLTGYSVIGGGTVDFWFDRRDATPPIPFITMTDASARTKILESRIRCTAARRSWSAARAIAPPATKTEKDLLFDTF